MDHSGIIDRALQYDLKGREAREKLLLLLNRNEWNIARVARLMGVTRRTIYLRLQRYNIPRERVPKTRPRRATA